MGELSLPDVVRNHSLNLFFSNAKHRTQEQIEHVNHTGQKERKGNDEDTGTERSSIETESTKNSSILSSITNSQEVGNLIKALLKNKDIQEEIRASLEELDARVEQGEE